MKRPSILMDSRNETGRVRRRIHYVWSSPQHAIVDTQPKDPRHHPNGAATMYRMRFFSLDV